MINEGEHFKPKPWLKIIVSILVISLLLNLYFMFSSPKEEIKEKPILNENNLTNIIYIDPYVATLGLDDYLKLKEEYITSYNPMRANIEKIIANTNGNFGFYFEDLTYKSWCGINEREKFKPASLLKVTTVSSILSLVEEGNISLDTKVKITQDDLNSRFGNLSDNIGSVMTIKQLIEKALIDSDNTAIKTLHQFITYDKWVETRLAMGLPVVSIQQSEQGTILTPKEFSRIFHSLYYSAYLSRESSNWVLSLLANTPFNKGIPSGVPANIKVAHKIGVWGSEGSLHDCGIVYAKKEPYLLCIMSMNTTQEEGERVISEISKEVYDYTSTH